MGSPNHPIQATAAVAWTLSILPVLLLLSPATGVLGTPVTVEYGGPLQRIGRFALGLAERFHLDVINNTVTVRTSNHMCSSCSKYPFSLLLELLKHAVMT